IAIMSVGDSMTNSVSSSLSSIGVNKVAVMVYPKDITGSYTYTDGDWITDDMLETYQNRFSQEIEAVSLSQSVGSGTVSFRHQAYSLNVTGVNPGYALGNPTGNIEMAQGRFITE